MSNELQSARRCVLLILSLVVFSLAAQFSAYTGLIASDDLGYSQYANQIANGAYHLEHHHYAIRYGVLLPVAALYRLFGLQEWTTVFLPMLCSCISPALAALIAWQMAGWRAAWITGVLMATFAVRVRYASILVPEPILMAMLLLAALVYLQAEKRNSAILALAAGIIFGGAYLTKEPGIFVGMAFGAFALIQRQWRIAFYLAVGCALVILGEMSWYLFESGDPLFRLHAMAVHNASREAIEANTHLAYRIWKEYPRMMLLPNNNFGIHSLVALWLAVVAVWLWRSCHKSLLLLWVALPYLF